MNVVKIIAIEPDGYTYQGNGDRKCILPTPDEARKIFCGEWPQEMTREEYYQRAEQNPPLLAGKVVSITRLEELQRCEE